MRHVVAALAVVVALSGCRKPGGRAAPPPEAEVPPPQKVATADARQLALEEEWSLYADMPIVHSAGGLAGGEKQMLRHLLAASGIVEELYMLEVHPKNLEWRDRIMASGTEIEKNVFMRYQAPWCSEGDCCALPDCEARSVGSVFWPADLTDAEFDRLGREPNGKDLLGPFTAVRRRDGGFEATPFARTEVLGARMKALAAELRSAAGAAPDESLRKFLASRADALEADAPFPYDDSDYDWIALGGDWEVAVGPYETYKEPRQVKALFEMYIGRVDAGLTSDLARFRENLQEMEDSIGDLVGPKLYRSRKLDPRISIRAVEIWMASGDGRMDRGAVVAFHLPNRGRSVDEGLYKKVMMVNHSMAFEPVVKARADLVLDPAQRPLVDMRSDISNVAFHEFAHGFGAWHELEVTTPDGEKKTVKEALGKHDALLEELKADAMGLWLVGFEKGRGWLDAEAEKKRYVSDIMHVLGLLQYPLDGVYPRMVAVELGWYLDAGAVSWDPATGLFSVDLARIPAAVESLAREVATIQLTGDRARAEALVSKYVVEKDGGKYELAGTLGRAREDMVGRFKAAGIKSPSLRYSVTGL